MPLRDILNRNAFRRPARNSPDVCAMSGYSLRRMKHSQSIDTFKSSSYPSSMRSETLTITCDLAMMRVITKLESSLISEKQRTPRRNTTPLARQDFSETQLKALSIERHQHASALFEHLSERLRVRHSTVCHLWLRWLIVMMCPDCSIDPSESYTVNQSFGVRLGRRILWQVWWMYFGEVRGICSALETRRIFTFLPPQKNLWVNSGKGRSPRL